MSAGENLLGIPETRLPQDPAQEMSAQDPTAIATAHPESSLGWAILAEQAYERGDDIQAYAYARTGYHRGLDALRKAGWKGQGPVPWEHPPNQGFLRALAVLSRAAESIDEEAEQRRCADFLRDSSPQAYRELLES